MTCSIGSCSGAHLLHFVLAAILGGVRHGVPAITVGQHFQNDRAVALAGEGECSFGRCFDRPHVHTVDLVAGNVERCSALREIRLCRRPANGGSHGIAVVLDHIDDRQAPQLGHIEAFIHLSLVGGAVTKKTQRPLCHHPGTGLQSQTRADRHLRSDNAVAAVEIFLSREHVHRAALAARIAAPASGQLRHDTACRHAHGQHMTVVTIAGDHLVAFFQRHLDAGNNRFLTDIKVAKPANETHAIKLTGFLFEAPYQQHLAIDFQLFFLAEVGDFLADGSFRGFRRFCRFGCTGTTAG